MRVLKTAVAVLFICLPFLEPAFAADQAESQKKDEAVPGLAEAQKARAALDDFIQAYENGNLSYVQNKLDPSMIGYQSFVDGMARDMNALKQIRVNLKDTQVMAAPDIAVIQTQWEKRFLSVTDFQPGLMSGRSMFLLHRTSQGWRIAAFSGDNLFSSASGAVAQMIFIPNPLSVSSLVVCTTCVTGGIAGVPCPTCFPTPTSPCTTCKPGPVPVDIEVADPSMAGVSFINVELSTGQGDRETVTLTAITPGRFVKTSITMSKAPIAAGDGVIEVTAPTTLTMRYLNATPGSNRPPSFVTMTVQLQ